MFGKSIENTRGHIDVRIVTKPETFQRLVASPLYLEGVEFNDGLMGVKLQRTTVCLNKPIYVGFTVLDLSKLLMYNFHYQFIKPLYMERARLLFTDTDSLCYQIFTANVYDDLAANMNMFDTSDYPTTHRLFSVANKKVMGKMKDETAGVPVEEFVGLKSKMYSLRYEGVEKKCAKGISKAVVKKSIRHADYKRVLADSMEYWNHQTLHVDRHSMKRIQNIHHRLHTFNINKISLSAYDDKRYISSNGVTSHAYGHFEIR